jgi:hypothetical protein
MALKVECVVDRCVDEKKSLRRFGRLEPLQFSFSPADWLVRIFRTIVGA